MKCVIRHGNRWLFTDDMQTHIHWTEDSGMASRHTEEWAREFCKGHPNFMIFKEDDFARYLESRRHSELKATYSCLFKDAVRKILPAACAPIPGNGASSADYAWEPYYARKISVGKAASDFVLEYQKRKVTKAT